ncbi:MAG: hypothetical protein IT383_01890 [Deltaproteobacteria bacterium]|nr:hypothetical protein [Deltaproteobacteria bacterium]
MSPVPKPAEPAASRSAFRLPLLGALLIAAGATLLVQPRVVEAVRAERVDPAWLAAAPVVFALVVVLAALDAWRGARARGHFRGPNVVAVAAAIAFLGLLLPDAFSEYRTRTSPADAVARDLQLSQHRDPRVRALVMELLGYRPVPADQVAEGLARGLTDRDPLVVEAAVQAVAHRAGVPLEGPDGTARAQQIVAGW